MFNGEGGSCLLKDIIVTFTPFLKNGQIEKKERILHHKRLRKREVNLLTAPLFKKSARESLPKRLGFIFIISKNIWIAESPLLERCPPPPVSAYGEIFFFPPFPCVFLSASFPKRPLKSYCWDWKVGFPPASLSPFQEEGRILGEGGERERKERLHKNLLGASLPF